MAAVGNKRYADCDDGENRYRFDDIEEVRGGEEIVRYETADADKDSEDDIYADCREGGNPFLSIKNSDFIYDPLHSRA